MEIEIEINRTKRRRNANSNRCDWTETIDSRNCLPISSFICLFNWVSRIGSEKYLFELTKHGIVFLIYFCLYSVFVFFFCFFILPLFHFSKDIYYFCIVKLKSNQLFVCLRKVKFRNLGTSTEMCCPERFS